MKTIKSICAASLMALTLCVPAYAGDIQIPGKPNPPTPPPATAPENSTAVTAVEGDITFLVLADLLWKLASIF